MLTVTPRVAIAKKWEMNSSAISFAKLETAFAFECISRVPDQSGISQACYIVEIYHSGLEPSIYQCIYRLNSFTDEGGEDRSTKGKPHTTNSVNRSVNQSINLK